MIGMPWRKHKETRAAGQQGDQRDKAAGAVEQEREKTAEERPYKPAQEQDVLGWGHRTDMNPP